MFYTKILEEIYIRFQQSYIRLEGTTESLVKSENKNNKGIQWLIDDYIDEYKNI